MASVLAAEEHHHDHAGEEERRYREQLRVRAWFGLEGQQSGKDEGPRALL
jgi:hypothetical protein